MSHVSLFCLLLVHFFQTQVQSSVHDVFVLKGGDVLLEVHNVPQDFFLFIWKFDEKGSRLVTFFSDNKPRISEAYTGRIDFHEDNKYSVILKNLQETDSGLYIARVTTETQQLILAQHNIIVQDVVSPVHLEVNSVSNSSHSCNVTLTCITADSHISSTFSCVNQKCDQDGGDQSKTTDSSATLQVYMRNHRVICKHSNQVSSTEDTTDLQDLCPKDPVQSSVHDVFVLKGGDVLLEVHNVPQDFFLFAWKFDKNDSILVTFGSDNKPRISKAYTGRIDFHEDNKYSVILKNLQETDSGLYIARVTTETQQLQLAQHNIIVQNSSAHHDVTPCDTVYAHPMV
ncbi:unnamed protein product [Ophioblennius macclurei]